MALTSNYIIPRTIALEVVDRGRREHVDLGLGLDLLVAVDTVRLEHGGLDGDGKAGRGVGQVDLVLTGSGGGGRLGLGSDLAPRALGGTGNLLLGSLGGRGGLEGDSLETATEETGQNITTDQATCVTYSGMKPNSRRPSASLVPWTM